MVTSAGSAASAGGCATELLPPNLLVGEVAHKVKSLLGFADRAIREFSQLIFRLCKHEVTPTHSVVVIDVT